MRSLVAREWYSKAQAGHDPSASGGDNMQHHAPPGAFTSVPVEEAAREKSVSQ